MIITQTPLRISLLGGNTDFPEYYKKYGGAVVTSTINKYIYCIVKERFDEQIYINYSKKEVVDTVDQIKHDIVRECLRLTGITKGIEIVFLSDIPTEGCGLGSSSAVTVGLLLALHAYKGEMVTKEALAREACHIEIEVLKKPIGIQDQYAVTYGGFNLMEFKKKGVTVTPLRMKVEDNLFLFYTGITRKSEDILSSMKIDKKILDKNKEIVREFVKSTGNLGDCLAQYWELKKKLNSSVTTRLIDTYYRLGISSGATGGKIVGAGGGGFLLFYVPEDRKKEFRMNILLKELGFVFTYTGSKIIFQ